MDVDRDGVTFTLPDRPRRLASVQLVQELGLAEGLDFTRTGPAWTLRLPRPDVDRMEYLFEVVDHNDRHATITDPANPLRAPGAFGEKSVALFPDYVAPSWLEVEPVTATTSAHELDAPLLDSTIELLLWTPDGLDTAAPLLLAHDGPEFAELGGLTHFLGAGIASGALPPMRAALLGPGDRNDWYSANPQYSQTIADVVVPALPDATVRLGVGVSLGALAMLHLHRTQPGTLDGLLLQSGSFFTPALDPQESHFSGFEAVTAFVDETHDSSADDHPVPTAFTCGVVEENLANNKEMAASLQRLGYPTTFAEARDAHNYTAWRDALHPALTELITAVVSAHAA